MNGPSSIPVVHASERYVIVDKPAGLLSVPGKGEGKQDCAVSRVRAMFPRASGPMVVHRLDMDTSGLLLIALDEDSQRELSRQFEERVTEKQYVALLDGEVEGEMGEILLPLRADILNRPYQIVDLEKGREAVTRWRVLAREVDRTRIQFEPLTGRSHQLRVHAAAGLGCPILGDLLYGKPPGIGHKRGAERLMLHASRLSFLEPGTVRRVEFESGVPF